ncbi:efflux transporter outer membrane subunit [Mangrovicoccus algicola]|uniref:Efflux transporter outer membrane subunit n=1 Tax=Mangrovicoccus algicola TaxID=2771008 RepID=A0A8J6YYD0_9RHOB|nr:efflux transporter outer membrane subunit [Mangrovicoccus algicola]MBE3638869.1 efflux transporter outer membrane subunit [Mangrovicoccus algicola]
MTRSLICLALLAAACAPVGPDYVRPDLAMQARFAEGDAAAIGEVATRRWWTAYNDAMLNDLVARGLAQNLDIAVAVERIRAAEAGLRAAGAAAAVSGDAGGSWTRQGGDGQSVTQGNSVSLSGSVVLDLFGGLRRGAQSAAADLAAAEADEGTARLAYLSAITAAYIDARYYQEALALNRQQIELQRETLEMTRAKLAAGSATRYELVQAQAAFDASQAGIPGQESSFLAQVYAIATLLGEPSGPLIAAMEPGRAQPRAGQGLSLGMPAELLRNRPDVRAAEQALIGATADVGVAEADLLPSISLSGTLSQTRGNAWSFGPDISLPVLSQPRLRAERARAISQAKQAEIDWRATILGAVEDVQSAHSRWLRLRREAELRETSVRSYEEAARLSRGAFAAGSLQLTDLLDDDSTLAGARISLAGTVRDLASEWAAVQVALGAGAYAEP